MFLFLPLHVYVCVYSYIFCICMYVCNTMYYRGSTQYRLCLLCDPCHVYVAKIDNYKPIINQVLRIIQIAVKSDVKTGRI